MNERSFTRAASLLVACHFCARPSLGAPFSPGTIAVLRVQSNDGSLSENKGVQLLMDEYGTNGSLVQTIQLPTNGPNRLVVSDAALAEATLTRTPNGRWLCFGGYNAPVDLTNLPASSSAQYPRQLATVDVFGNLNVVAADTNYYDGTNIRGGVSDGTNNFWSIGTVSGTGAGGLFYRGFDARTSLVQAGNHRVLNLINGALYFTTCCASGGIYKYPGLPTSNGTVPTRIITDTSSPYGFAINPAGNIAYLADDSQSSVGGIQRFTNSAGSWSFVYTLRTGITNTGARGVAVDWSGTSPVVYASTSENTFSGNPGNRLIRVVDSGSGAVATTLATCDTNCSFRGVALVPQPVGAQSQIQRSISTNSSFRLYWFGVGGSQYVVQAATSLGTSNAFTDISPVLTLSGSGVVSTYVDLEVLPNQPTRFYRIRSN